MTGRRVRSWRWAVALWAVTVVAAGGLTLWLRDSAAPPEPRGWYRDEEPAAPLLRQDGDVPPCPEAGEPTRVVCAYASLDTGDG
ncbi:MULTISPECIES: hypothetical protein [unclassified Streptomyces]|uniref:hypothetical protein n=1 Tax=unclassified Streptomyces TaxID=2593676 RepID=UPI003D71C0FA